MIKYLHANATDFSREKIKEPPEITEKQAERTELQAERNEKQAAYQEKTKSSRKKTKYDIFLEDSAKENKRTVYSSDSSSSFD